MIGRAVSLIRRGDLPPRRALAALPQLPRYLIHRVLGDGRAGRPLLLTIELTYRCNLPCPYCYLTADHPGEETLSAEDIDRLLDGLAGPRPIIHLTGGEPLLRTDLAEIISRIRARGCWCTVSTNGTLIASPGSEWLKTAGPDRLTISLNGPEAIHDTIISRPGAFARTMAGIIRLGDWGLLQRVSVNCLLHPENLSSLPGFLRFIARMGIKRISFQHPINRRSPSRPGFERKAPLLAMNPDRVNGAIAALRRAERARGVRLRFIPELTSEEIDRWYTGGYSRACRYPYFASRIGPGGDVYPCPNSPVSLGNIRSRRLSDIWNDPGYRSHRRARRTLPRPAACLNCCKI